MTDREERLKEIERARQVANSNTGTAADRDAARTALMFTHIPWLLGELRTLAEQRDSARDDFLVIVRRNSELSAALAASQQRLEQAQMHGVQLIASALKKILPPEEITRLAHLADPDAPLNDFLAVLRADHAPESPESAAARVPDAETDELRAKVRPRRSAL